MNHMTATGIKGLDLYAWTNGKWQFVNSARPAGKSNQQIIISNMLANEREYLLYLPLYDGVINLQIGIDSTAVIEKPLLQIPSATKPIVCYGTSITQGGCANRPGMSYTSLLERKLNREVINLGFSGNGQLDYEIAELMSRRTDAGLFILDFIPNVTQEQVQDKTATFIQKLRAHNPDIPILFVESILFPHSMFDVQMYKTVTDKNKALRKEYELLRKQYKNIYYLPATKLIGTDGETTVDGIHLTDLGFTRFADELQKTVRQIIR
jgi:lysophospholipase L1-like esterase